MLENVQKFIAEFDCALKNLTFVKMTLGNYKGADEHLQKILLRLIKTKKGTRLSFQYRYATRDIVKNYDFDEGVALIDEFLENGFLSAHLFTTANDFQLAIGKKGKSRLNTGKPTFKGLPDAAHDRQKKVLIDPGSFYLKALGITTDEGVVRDKQQDKWRQINKFVETLGSLFDNSPVNGKKEIKIVDMGSGKGYLTFAAYDYFTTGRGINADITGVEARSELVDLCNDIAHASEFTGLKFVTGTIADFDVAGADILIALHACDTATDDAIYKGIQAGAGLIMAAPCCHKEVRPQIKPPEMFAGVLRHGIMLERTAETITDGLRALLMERSGYSTRVFEFISTEHTPKNNMIAGTKTGKRSGDAAEQIEAIKDFYGIKEQRLEKLLESDSLVHEAFPHGN
jgi:hypothetical protein